MPDTPRVLVVKMHGSGAGFHNGLWHWHCTADHLVTDFESPTYRGGAPIHYGHWTTIGRAHDDGREHARHCAPLRLAKLLAEIDAQYRAADLLADLDARKGVRLSMWVFVADTLNKLRTEATDA